MLLRTYICRRLLARLVVAVRHFAVHFLDSVAKLVFFAAALLLRVLVFGLRLLVVLRRGVARVGSGGRRCLRGACVRVGGGLLSTELRAELLAAKRRLNLQRCGLNRNHVVFVFDEVEALRSYVNGVIWGLFGESSLVGGSMSCTETRFVIRRSEKVLNRGRNYPTVWLLPPSLLAAHFWRPSLCTYALCCAQVACFGELSSKRTACGFSLRFRFASLLATTACVSCDLLGSNASFEPRT